jgi:hypothetical protein
MWSDTTGVAVKQRQSELTQTAAQALLDLHLHSELNKCAGPPGGVALRTTSKTLIMR